MNLYFVWVTLKRCYRGMAVLFNLITERELVRELPWRYVKRRVSRSPVMILQLIAILAILIVLPLSLAVDALAPAAPPAVLAWFIALGSTMVRGFGRFVRDVAGR